MSPDFFAVQPPDRPRRPFKLTRWFSLLSFVCIGVASVFSSIVLSRFGGAVSIASEPGQWTEVQVELPMHSA